MRTPLNALALNIEGAKLALQSASKTAEYLERAARNVKALATIIEALLDVAADPTRTLKIEEFEPSDLIAQALAQITPLAEQKNLRLRTQEQTLPSVMVDGNRIVRVLVNLLSNAVRFSPNGGEIVVTMKARSNDGHKVIVFSVSDDGPGVAAEDLDRIFLSGVSIEKREKNHSTGLGLAVCKEIVEVHGGRIWVETGRSTGATFSFAMPMFLSGKTPRPAPAQAA